MKNIKLYLSIMLIFIFAISIALPISANDSIYVWSNNSTSSSTNTTEITTNSEVTNSNSLNLESGSAILIEQSTGQVLYSHNIHEQLRPASVTKVMSILLIMEALDSRKNFSH